MDDRPSTNTDPLTKSPRHGLNPSRFCKRQTEGYRTALNEAENRATLSFVAHLEHRERFERSVGDSHFSHSVLVRFITFGMGDISEWGPFRELLEVPSVH